MKTYRKLWALSAVAAATALTGCWDDSNDDTVLAPVANEVPDSAGVSGAALFSYILSLGGNDESSEPATIKDGFLVPADETSEPAVLS